MDYLAYLLKHHFPSLFPALAALARAVTSMRFGRKLADASTHGEIIGTVAGAPAKIRRLTETDREALKDFLQKLPDGHLAYFQPHGFDDKALNLILRSKAFSAYGLFVDEKLSGYALLKVSPAGSAFIGLVLAPEMIGLGLGGFLTKYLHWQARLAGLRPCSTISKDNLASLESHRSVGDLRVIRELPNNYQLFELVAPDNDPPVLDFPNKVMQRG